LKTRKIKSISAYLLLLPYFLLFFVFFLVPAITILPMSFTRWSLLDKPRFVGFQNYLKLINDSLFWKSVGNTFYYTILVTALLTILGLLLALLINQNLKGKTLGRMFVIIPYVISSAAAGVIWKWMYNQNFGIINSYMRAVNLPVLPFLTNTKWAMPSIVFMNAWWSVGFNTIIYLAALQGIPKELYEAAEVDGANKLQAFRYITFPFLKPITLYVTVLCAANSFQMFDEAYMMTQGGPVGSTATVVFRIYNTAFEAFRFGEAAAISMLTLLFIIVMSLIQFKLSKREG
jgi:multiple sugar transport system permease protein